MKRFLTKKIIASIAALALLVGVGVLISSRDTSSTTRNVALVVATPCTKPGQVTKVSKQSVVCATTNTGSLWYATMKTKGKAQPCTTPGAIRKKSDVVWVCGVTKKKKLWQATQPLSALSAKGDLLTTSPDASVVADNAILADPQIPDDKTVTQVVDDATTPTVAPTTPTVAPTTPVTIPLTCATGGTCVVGSTGPGGGTVFYVASPKFTSTGSACNTACKYLEAAPAGWITTDTPAEQTNCSAQGTISVDPKCEWSGNTIDYALTGTEIGTGYANTSAMIAQSDTAGRAGTVARAFQGGGKTDWFLPSKDELNQMFAKKGIIGGFASASYWSSSENFGDSAWYQGFWKGGLGATTKADTSFVRPVRAF